MKSISKLFLATAFAAFFMAPAQAQNAGTVTANAFAVGSGPGIDGFVSVLCTSAQVPIGQAGVPQCKTITGDVSITAAGATSIGIGSAVQAFDTDLACIAALSSTGLIKRTGSGTCSAGTAALSDLATGTPDTAIGYFGSTTASATSVPNCTGALTYSTSTHTFGCNSTSAGNVSNVGTPTNGQIAQWTTSTTIQGVSLASLLTAMATQNTNATNPSGTTSTAGVMMGLGSTCKITPAVTGRVRFTISGSVANNNAAHSTTVGGRYGSGTAPANNAATAGTAVLINSFTALTASAGGRRSLYPPGQRTRALTRPPSL